MMALSVNMFKNISLPLINRSRVNGHVLAASVLGGALFLLGAGTLIFGNPEAGAKKFVLAIDTPTAHEAAPLNQHLRAENGHQEVAPKLLQPINGEPRLAGVEDLGHDQQGEHHGKEGNMHAQANTGVSGPVPDPGLTAAGPGGVLPIIAADGRRPADVYARPFELPAQSPAIAIIVGGLGLKKATTQAAIDDLPPEVTLSFVPYTNDLQGWINKARAAGHEVMIELPMEPFDYPQNDPGPQTLLASVSNAENARRLEWLLSRAWGYFAVTNYMGSKFTASESAVAPVVRQLHRRGVDFIYDGEARRSSLSKVANEEHLRWTTADRIIDTEPSSSAIDDQLLHLEAIALQSGVALGIGFSWPITMERLGAWAKTVTKSGYVLVPASAALSIRNGNVTIDESVETEPQMVAQTSH